MTCLLGQGWPIGRPSVRETHQALRQREGRFFGRSFEFPLYALAVGHDGPLGPRQNEAQRLSGLRSRRRPVLKLAARRWGQGRRSRRAQRGHPWRRRAPRSNRRAMAAEGCWTGSDPGRAAEFRSSGVGPGSASMRL